MCGLKETLLNLKLNNQKTVTRTKKQNIVTWQTKLSIETVTEKQEQQQQLEQQMKRWKQKRNGMFECFSSDIARTELFNDPFTYLVQLRGCCAWTTSTGWTPSTVAELSSCWANDDTFVFVLLSLVTQTLSAVCKQSVVCCHGDDDKSQSSPCNGCATLHGSVTTSVTVRPADVTSKLRVSTSLATTCDTATVSNAWQPTLIVPTQRWWWTTVAGRRKRSDVWKYRQPRMIYHRHKWRPCTWYKCSWLMKKQDLCL